MTRPPTVVQSSAQTDPQSRPLFAFGIAIPIGTLGGLIGLGGAEFRLPVLAGTLGYMARQAVALNLAVSLVTVMASLAIRSNTLALTSIIPLLPPMLSMIVGALITAFVGTGLVRRLSNEQLERIILVFLVVIGGMLIIEGFLPQQIPALIPDQLVWRVLTGVLFGLAIGLASSMLGVAGGELIIPTLVFAYGADIKGEEIENPRFYRRDEADLKRIQQLKDAAKNAQRWDDYRRYKKALAHVHERISNRRTNFAHQESRKLVNRYHVIVFEDLAPMEMGRSRGMRKSILDVAWTQFIEMTTVKAEEAGRRVILVDPRNTSKMCSSCGTLAQKQLSDRTHTCPACGLVMGRDHNAALNILHRGLQSLRL